MLTNRVSRARYPHRLAALLAGTALIALGAFEADAVESQAEIQINLCSDSTQLIRALHLAEQGKPTTVWLFDTPGLELNRNGLRLRVRERGEFADLTLKAAGRDCSKVKASLLGGQGKCEADLHGDSFEDVVSLERTLDRRSLKALLAPEAGAAAGEYAVQAADDKPAQCDRCEARCRGLRAATARHQTTRPTDRPGLSPCRSALWRRGLGAAGRRTVRRAAQKVPRETALARRTELEAKIAPPVSICDDQRRRRGTS
jgi:hypothetical protein